MKNEFIKLSAVLCAITLVAGLLLAGVNEITAPRIAEAEKNAAVEAMQKILPDAENFTELSEYVSEAKSGNENIGYCVKVSSNGYGGAIVMMVGFDSDLKVQGIEILSHSETAGLGAKITEESFKEQFSDKEPLLQVVKGNAKSSSQISAVTGATISSRAVASGIEAAYKLVQEAKGETK